MSVIPTRINSSGTFLVNSDFNEVTFNTMNPVIKNAFVYTESFNAGGWAPANISITQSATTAPNGTLTATKFTDTVSSNHYILLDTSITAGTRYVQSVFVKSAEITFFHLSPSSGFTTTDNWVNFDLTAGTYSIQGLNTLGATAGIIDAGNGWWRCWMSLTAQSTTLGRIAFGPTSSLTTGRLGDYTGNGINGLYVWGAQIEVGSIPTIYQGIAAAGTLVTPTFANKTTTGTYYVTGNFDEVTYNSVTPAIKNLLRYTEEFNNVSWSKTRSSISAIDTITAPNGTLTAEKLSEDTTVNNNHLIVSNTIAVTSGTAYTGSVYIKAAERSFSFVIFGTGASPALGVSSVSVNLSTGAMAAVAGSVTSFNSIAVGDGWYRVSITATATSTGNSNFNIYTGIDGVWANRLYTGDGTSGIYIWGAQVEVGSTATIYQGIAAANTLVTPGFAKRETSDGSLYVTDKFDEVTGMIVTSGLVAYYDAGKAASQPATGATWYDISDSRNNATPTASPPTFNSAGYFTLAAVNAQRYLTTALNPTTWAEPWTIEVWMYTPTGAVWGNGVNRSHHISKGSTAGTWGIIRNPTDNQVTTWIRGAAEQAATPVATLARDRWHQFVGTWDGINTVSSYLNGEFVGSATITPTGAPDTGSLVIGGANNQTISGSPGTYYDGNIAAVMMYNRALPLNEVTNNFEALRDRFGI